MTTAPTSCPEPTFATDIVTFYHPQFWGLRNQGEFLAWAERHPERFWEGILNASQTAGLGALEITFRPGNMHGVLRAFGSPEAFRNELENRGLALVSAFIIPGEAPDWNTAEPAEVAQHAREAAAHLRAAGGDVLVVGLPMRTAAVGTQGPYIDSAYMARVGAIADLVGEALMNEQGIRLALHTESNSVLWHEHDIDLFLGLTDPRFVWLCPDSCHITLGGGAPDAVAERHAERIALAHWKDAVGPMQVDLAVDETVYAQQQKYMAEIGAGVVDWRRWASALRGTHNDHIIVIELDEAPRPIEALQIGKRRIQVMLA